MSELPERLEALISKKDDSEVAIVDERGLVACTVSHTEAAELAEALVIGYNARFGTRLSLDPSRPSAGEDSQ